MDDLVIRGEHIADIDHIKQLLSDRFKMKEIQELHYILRIEVIWTLDDIMISQLHYILNLLFRFGMTECKPIATPLDRNLKLDADSDTEECEPTNYRKLVRILIYLTITRPYLNYPIELLSQFMQTPQNIHVDCVKRMLRYISGIMDSAILYKSATQIRLKG